LPPGTSTGIIAVIDGLTNTIAGTISLPNAFLAWVLAFNSQTNTLYAAARADQVLVIDPSIPRVTARIPVGSSASPGAYDLGVNPVTNTVYVALLNENTVAVIDGATNTVRATVAVGVGPCCLGVDSETNTIFVSNETGTGDTVSVIDGVDNIVSGTVTVGRNPAGVAANAVTGLVYVAETGGSHNVSVLGALMQSARPARATRPSR
jgi:YVTN family beta-propeller protein